MGCEKKTFIFRRKAVVRQQCPFESIFCLKTIHKAQGQTKDRIIVDMTSGPRPHQHYVAFSRVTSLQGLFLLNGLNGQIKVDKTVILEMDRLRRDACVNLSYTPASSYNCDLITVFQNSQSLRLHFPLVQNDVTFTDADIICLAETRFHPMIRNDPQARTPNTRPPHGLAMYEKNCHKVVYTETLSTDKFESLAVGILNLRSQRHYTILIVYKL